MNRAQFAHVLRAAAAISEQSTFIVGSQSVLAQFADVPATMARSTELDLYPRDHPELADLIEGAIGADSMFHEQFGYHADAVGPRTSRLPHSWESRSLQSKEKDVVAVCPEIHDLAAAKLLAGRPKDMEWLEAGTEAALIEPDRVEARLPETDATAEELALARTRLRRLAGTT
jgi:hypothetical protein